MTERSLRRMGPGGDPAAWELVAAPPAPALRGVIRRYHGYRESVAAPVRRAELPTGDVVMILNLGAPWLIGDDRRPEALFDSFVAGVDDARSFVAAAGPAQCLQIDFTPIGAYRVFRRPMADLAHRVTRLDDLSAGWAADLVDRLRDSPGWAARFDLADAAIARRIDGARAPAPGLVQAWHRLEAADGRVPVAALAAELGWSRKHLATRFRDQVGVAPKTLARVLRFRRAVDRLDAVAAADWAGFAIECGYADQSHLIREFRALSGFTPGELVRRHGPEAAGTAGA